MKQPKPFQIDGAVKSVAFLTNSPANAVYNGSDPGVGKTLMSILTLQYLGVKKAIIVCPKIMLYTWKKELESWAPEYTVTVIESHKDLTYLHTHRAKHAFVVAYSFVWRAGTDKAILKFPWECVVFDEAHKLSNRKAHQTKYCLKDLWKKVKYKIALSGTPFTACVTQCYALFNLMLPNTFGNYYQFAETFSNAERTPWGTKYSGVKNAKALSKLIRSKFFFKFNREDVLTELPKRCYQQITLPKKYSCKEYEKMLREMEKEGTDVSELPDIPVHMMGLIRLQGELKVDPITEYVEDLLEQNIPVLLFTLNKSVLAKYKELLKDFKPVIIDGETSNLLKNENIESFQTGKTNLAIVNIKAASLGITLNRARYVVFAQLPFTPADIEQAVSRANRMGATEQTNISYFVVEKSLDEKISSRILGKLKDFNEVFNR